MMSESSDDRRLTDHSTKALRTHRWRGSHITKKCMNKRCVICGPFWWRLIYRWFDFIPRAKSRAA